MGLRPNESRVIYDPATSEVVVRKKTGHRLRTPFSAVAPFTNRSRKRMNVDVFDLLDLLEKVSKPALSVFNNLKFNRSEETNITTYQSEEVLSKTERESLSRRLKELKDVGLIRRVKKQIPIEENKVYAFKDPRKTFIINPDILRCTNHDEAELIWHACGGEGKEDA